MRIRKSKQQNTPKPAASVFVPQLFLSGMNTPVCVQLLINEPSFTLGSQATCQGMLAFNNEISREHCRITWQNGQYYLEDLNSLNGTWLNGMSLAPGQKYPIHPGDQIRMSAATFLLEPIYSLIGENG